MNWSSLLNPNEQILWQGKPAPFCYTFRNYVHAFAGLALSGLVAFWLKVSLYLDASYPHLWWTTLPFIGIGIYLCIGQFVLARLEWRHTLYLFTDQRLILFKGIFKWRMKPYNYSQVTSFSRRPVGSLATFKIHVEGENKAVFMSCVEHPEALTTLLTDIVQRIKRDNGEQARGKAA